MLGIELRAHEILLDTVFDRYAALIFVDQIFERDADLTETLAVANLLVIPDSKNNCTKTKYTIERFEFKMIDYESQ